MGRHLSVATAIEKNKIASDTPFLMLMEIDVVDPNTREITETLYLAKNTEAVLFNGEDYQPGNFTIQMTSKQNEQPSVSITAIDTTGFIQARTEAYLGGTQSEVRILIVNADRLDRPAEIMEQFKVLDTSIKDMRVTFKIGVENPLQIQFPKHKQMRDRCTWRFRETLGCKYAGADQTCSYTLDGPNGCRAKGNQINFGGLRGIVPLNI